MRSVMASSRQPSAALAALHPTSLPDKDRSVKPVHRMFIGPGREISSCIEQGNEAWMFAGQFLRREDAEVAHFIQDTFNHTGIFFRLERTRGID